MALYDIAPGLYSVLLLETLPQWMTDMNNTVHNLFYNISHRESGYYCYSVGVGAVIQSHESEAEFHTVKNQDL